MARPFYLLNDAGLLAWSNVFSAALTEHAAEFGITADQASQIAALNDGFATALSAWQNPTTRTPVTSTQKTDARLALIAGAKYLVNTINSNPATTDAQRSTLNIPIRKTPTPIPAPDQSPMIDVAAVNGRTVTLKLHNDSAKRGKPASIQGASVFTYVGDTAPTDPSAYTFQGLISKTRFEITFPDSTTANTVWVTANWFNGKGQTGNACAPVRINLPASQPVPITATLKIAA